MNRARRREQLVADARTVLAAVDAGTYAPRNIRYAAKRRKYVARVRVACERILADRTTRDDAAIVFGACQTLADAALAILERPRIDYVEISRTLQRYSTEIRAVINSHSHLSYVSMTLTVEP